MTSNNVILTLCYPAAAPLSHFALYIYIVSPDPIPTTPWLSSVFTASARPSPELLLSILRCSLPLAPHLSAYRASVPCPACYGRSEACWRPEGFVVVECEFYWTNECSAIILYQSMSSNLNSNYIHYALCVGLKQELKLTVKYGQSIKAALYEKSIIQQLWHACAWFSKSRVRVLVCRCGQMIMILCSHHCATLTVVDIEACINLLTLSSHNSGFSLGTCRL